MLLVIGADGQLGRSLVEVLSTSHLDFITATRIELDITNSQQVHDFLHGHDLATVINCAAWTAVDDAEDNIAEALRINYEGPKNLATACLSNKSRLIHISTDYVFTGDAKEPYEVDTPTNPLNAYGRTKQMGDSAVLTLGSGMFPVIRTAWLYSKYGRNFAKTMVGRALKGQAVAVVNDQFGQPTLAQDLAHLIVEVASHPSPPPIIHGTNSGEASWFEFASFIFESLQIDTDLVTPVPSESFPTRAARPRYSVLSHKAFGANGLTEMRHWKHALSSEIQSIRNAVESEDQ